MFSDQNRIGPRVCLRSCGSPVFKAHWSLYSLAAVGAKSLPRRVPASLQLDSSLTISKIVLIVLNGWKWSAPNHRLALVLGLSAGLRGQTCFLFWHPSRFLCWTLLSRIRVSSACSARVPTVQSTEANRPIWSNLAYYLDPQCAGLRAPRHRHDPPLRRLVSDHGGCTAQYWLCSVSRKTHQGGSSRAYTGYHRR